MALYLWIIFITSIIAYVFIIVKVRTLIIRRKQESNLLYTLINDIKSIKEEVKNLKNKY
jgi:hypothetical protein